MKIELTEGDKCHNLESAHISLSVLSLDVNYPCSIVLKNNSFSGMYLHDITHSCIFRKWQADNDFGAAEFLLDAIRYPFDKLKKKKEKTNIYTSVYNVIRFESYTAMEMCTFKNKYRNKL